MKARPILFSAGMVRALLAGTKTQTRRKMKGSDIWGQYVVSGRNLRDNLWRMEGADPLPAPRENPVTFLDTPCPYGKPGDLLWVREACRAKELTTEEADSMWKASPDYDGLPPDHLYGLDGVAFSADNAFAAIKNTREAADAWADLNAYRGKRGATAPPIHMPRWASRLTLRITDVRVQRLREISNEDAIAEGATSKPDDGPFHLTRSPIWSMDWPATKPAEGWFEVSLRSPKYAFANYVNCIHGGPRWNLKPTNVWNKNPWVWAISFEVICANVDAVLAAKEAV